MIESNLEFIAQEVRTGNVLGNVELVNFTVKEVINNYGQWSGGVVLKDRSTVSQIDLTEPWKHRIFAVLEDKPAFCLDLWTRQRSLKGNTMQVGGKLSGSWLEKVSIGGRNGQNLDYQQIEQQAIARDLITKAVAEWGPAGFDPVTVTGTGSVLRDKTTWEAVDGKPYGEALIDLVNLQNGFQFKFEPYSPSPGVFKVRLVTGYPYAVNRAPLSVDFTHDGYSYSGNIRDLMIDESIAALATDVVVWGTGEGNTKLKGVARNTGLANAIPSIQRTEMRNDVIGQGWLDSRAQLLMSASTTAQLAPIVSIAANDPSLPLGSYTVGDQVSVSVDPTPQFPYGLTGTWRIFEIDYNPETYGEEVRLTIGDPNASL